MCEEQKKSEELMDKLEDYLQSIVELPSKSIFHYTNYKGLKGILEAKCLWLTDYKYLNDPLEIQHGKKIILNCVDIHNQGYPKFNHFFKSFIEYAIDNSYKTYLVSFCEEGDYLPAWRYYGDNGAGFSIGFKKNYFTHCKTPIAQSFNESSTLIFKIKYASEIDTYINTMLNIANNVWPNWQIFPEPDRYITALVSGLISILPQSKHKDYENEKEWRVCLLPRIYREEGNKWFPFPLPLKELIISSKEIETNTPFIKNVITTIPRFKSLKFEYDNIESIIIGPRLDFPTAKIAIQKMLLDFGMNKSEINNISINKSDRPFQ